MVDPAQEAVTEEPAPMTNEQRMAKAKELKAQIQKFRGVTKGDFTELKALSSPPDEIK